MRHALIVLPVVMAVCLAGCRTGGPARDPAAGGASVGPPRTKETVSIDPAVLAAALTYYGFGALREELGDPGAIDDYLEAAKLQPTNVRLYLSAAALLWKQGQMDSAVKTLRTACRNNPEQAEPRLWIGRIYQTAKRFPEAERAFQEAIALAPSSIDGYLSLATVYSEQKENAKAIRTLETAIEKVSATVALLRILGDFHYDLMRASQEPELSDYRRKAIEYYTQAQVEPFDELSLTYLQRRGELHLQARQFDQALECFERLDKEKPDQLDVKRKLAFTYLALNRKNQAIETLKTISQLAPRHFEVHYYLGELYEKTGDIPQAIESYELARRSDNPNPMVFLKLALLQMDTRPEAALQTLRDGVERLPQAMELQEFLAQVYLSKSKGREALSLFEKIEETVEEKSGRLPTADFYMSYAAAAQLSQLPERAAELYRTALEMDPSLLEAYFKLAFLYVSQKKTDEAFAVVQQADALMRDNPRGFYFLGLLNLRAERFHEAVKAFEKAETLLRRKPDERILLDSAFYFNFGAACERDGAWDKAETLFEKAISLDPENPEPRNYLAYSWAEKGILLDKAMAYIGKALAQEPGNPAFIDTLGWILYKQGDLDAALDELSNAQSLMPGDPTILEHLGDVLFALGDRDEAVRFWKQSLSQDPKNKAVEKKLKDQGVDTAPLLPAKP
ncbi:MAG: tetratricopeptide repeat protein [Lentisphaerae bacterium]|nr:tetratricopeptide repeat protein [Lentisphaerota bacterium]